MSYMPLRQDLVEHWGRRYAADADKMLYNGPFTLTKWVHGAHLLDEKVADSRCSFR